MGVCPQRGWQGPCLWEAVEVAKPRLIHLLCKCLLSKLCTQEPRSVVGPWDSGPVPALKGLPVWWGRQTHPIWCGSPERQPRGMREQATQTKGMESTPEGTPEPLLGSLEGETGICSVPIVCPPQSWPHHPHSAPGTPTDGEPGLREAPWPTSGHMGAPEACRECCPSCQG